VSTPPGTQQRLGFIGLGNIGGALCANLVADGHHVTAYDIDPRRLESAAAAGAQPADSVAGVAAASETTFLSLPSPAIMESVASAWLEACPEPGRTLIDLTTNAPSTVRAVGARLAAAGARFVEAPVTGGAVGARNRKLVFITGGDDETVAQVEPLLRTIGRATFHLGALGSGNVGKLVNSLMAFTTMWVSLEGLALAAKSDVDLRTLLEMVRTSGGANSYLERRVEEISERGRPTEFAMELAAKDAGLMLEIGEQTGVPLPVASAVHQMLSYAKAQGLGGHDISDLVEVMERAASVKLYLRPPD
jgi:3-hydroxyisobutyrate dehydrogenase-like beta-hydroxyacid dehydrogenase